MKTIFALTLSILFIGTLSISTATATDSPADRTEKKSTVEEIKFTVYPNPANHAIAIKSDQDYSRIVLSNILGKQMISIPNQASNIDISNLSSGMYIVSIIAENGNHSSQRVLVE